VAGATGEWRGKRIGVLLGGLSAERKVSLKSGAAVAGALRRRGYDVVEIDVGRDLPARLVESGAQVAWLALHGKFGEDGCVQGLCEVMGLPYTGSGVRASAVCMDKTATKRAVAGVPGVVMAQDHLWRTGDPVPDHVLERMGYPVMVKPPSTGSTIGMSKATSRAELVAGLEVAAKYGDEVLLEQFVEGDEITVAVIDGRPLPVVRILPESGWFDFEAKYTKGKTTYEVPAKILQAAWDAAQAAAVAAYRAIGCRGLCRADFIVRHSDHVPVFLELNTLPGMTETSLSPMAAGQVGVSFEDLVETILNSATCSAPEVG
jgi:D-alanine-D-alanine ligase